MASGLCVHARSGTIKCRRQGRETSPSAALIVAWCRRPARFERATGPRWGWGLGAQGSHDRALHINTIVSPIPTKVYKPATVIPRQTSAMTLSGWGVICLSGTALPLGYFPTRIDHAGGRELFRFQDTKAYRRRNGNFTKCRPRSTSGARD